MKHHHGLLPALAVVALCAACRTSFEDLRKKHSAVEAQLAQAEKVGKLLELTPLVSKDETIILRSSPPPVGAGSLWGVLGMAANVSLMYQEAFADLSQHGPTAHRLPGSNLLTSCAALLRHRQCPSTCASRECSCSYSFIEDILARCAEVRYLLAVRTLEYGAPAVLNRTTPDLGLPDRGPEGRVDGAHRDLGEHASADRRVESWTFRGGLMRAEVHVFELASGRRLGGFRIRAESGPRLQRTTDLNQPYPLSSTRSAVDEDFAASCLRALLEGIRRYVPGAYR
jgi:hypothetical protein